MTRIRPSIPYFKETCLLINFFFIQIMCYAAYGVCNLPLELDDSHYFIEGKVVGYDSVKRSTYQGEYYAPIVKLRITHIYFGKKKIKNVAIYLGPGVPNFCGPRRNPAHVRAKYILQSMPKGKKLTYIGVAFNDISHQTLALSVRECFHLLTYRGSIKSLKSNTRENSRLHYTKKLPPRLQYYLTQISISKSRTQKEKIVLVESLMWYRGHNLTYYIEALKLSSSTKVHLINRYKRLHNI